MSQGVAGRTADWLVWRLALALAPIVWLPRVRQQVRRHLGVRAPALQQRLASWDGRHWTALRERLGLPPSQPVDLPRLLPRVRFLVQFGTSRLPAFLKGWPARIDGAKRSTALPPHLDEDALYVLLEDVEAGVARSQMLGKRLDAWMADEEQLAAVEAQAARAAVGALETVVSALERDAPGLLSEATRLLGQVDTRRRSLPPLGRDLDEATKVARKAEAAALAAQAARAAALERLAALPTYPGGPHVTQAVEAVKAAEAEAARAVDALAARNRELATAIAARKACEQAIAADGAALSHTLDRLLSLVASVETTRRAFDTPLATLRGPQPPGSAVDRAVDRAVRLGASADDARARLKSRPFWHVHPATAHPEKGRLLAQAEALAARASQLTADWRRRQAALASRRTSSS